MEFPGFGPVDIGCFVTPFRQSGHQAGMRSIAAESSHGLFTVPLSQTVSPERQAGVYEQPPAEKAARIDAGSETDATRMPGETAQIALVVA